MNERLVIGAAASLACAATAAACLPGARQHPDHNPNFTPVDRKSRFDRREGSSSLQRMLATGRRRGRI